MSVLTQIAATARAEKLARILAAVRQAGTHDGAAKLLGVSQSTVTRWMARAGDA